MRVNRFGGYRSFDENLLMEWQSLSMYHTSGGMDVTNIVLVKWLKALEI